MSLNMKLILELIQLIDEAISQTDYRNSLAK